MIDWTRKFARRVVAHALYYSGALWVLAAYKLRRRAIVLMYHRVLPETADTYSSESIIVRPDTFERQMRFLSRHFRILSLADLAAHFSENRALPSGSCVITFDDGWFDNFHYALPILRRLNVPATIFLATDYIGSRKCFWQERLARQLFRAVQLDGPPHEFAVEYLGTGIDSVSSSEQKRIIRHAIDCLKSAPDSVVTTLESRLSELLRDVGEQATENGGDDRFMTWQEVSSLVHNSPVTVGAHGCSHLPLTSMPLPEAAQELRRSHHEISDKTRSHVTAVAYPNGDFSEDVVQAARELGYTLGFTTRKGPTSILQDALVLPRINIHEDASKTLPEFLSALLLVFRRLRRSEKNSRA